MFIGLARTFLTKGIYSPKEFNTFKENLASNPVYYEYMDIRDDLYFLGGLNFFNKVYKKEDKVVIEEFVRTSTREELDNLTINKIEDLLYKDPMSIDKEEKEKEEEKKEKEYSKALEEVELF